MSHKKRLDRIERHLQVDAKQIAFLQMVQSPGVQAQAAAELEAWRAERFAEMRAAGLADENLFCKLIARAT